MNEIKFYLKCILVGILTGLIIIIYRVSLKYTNLYRKDFFATLLENGSSLKWIALIGFLLLSAVFLGFFMKRYPLISGGGIVFIKADIEKNIDLSSKNPLIIRVTIYKLIGALLALTSGLPFGIEGPSVQLGAEAGQGIGNATGSNDENKKYLVASGAAAGLAAAFNAPITGIFFAMEQVVKDLSYKYITSILITSTIVGWIVNRFFGTILLFNVQITRAMETRHYYLIIIFALFTAMIGKLFYIFLNFFKNMNSKIKLPYLVKQIVPLSIGIIASLFCIEITGEGYELVDKILTSDLGIGYLSLLFILKFVLFTYAASTEIPGGAFVPLIACGAVMGKIFGAVIADFFAFPPEYTPYFILLGMCLLLTSIIRAPMTGIMLVTEITGINNQYYSLALGVIGVIFFSEIFNIQPLYDTALSRYIDKIRGQQSSS